MSEPAPKSSRRTFLGNVSGLAAASLISLPRLSRAEAPPEVKKIRLVHFPAICTAPGYLAEALLHAEGFDEVEYVEVTANTLVPYIMSGRVDIWVDAAPSLVNSLATSQASVVLGGIHSGCYELLGKEDVRAIRDLKGRTVSISAYGSTEHIFVSSMAAYVGMDPRKDINWLVGSSSEEAMQSFAQGKADAYLGFAPQPQQLLARKVGHVIVNTTYDRPWSQYFCCMLTGNRDFVRRNPVATKRAVRAFFKAADLCASDPKRAARYMVDKGYVPSYDLAVEILSELPFSRWRDANPEDTLRFHALRLYEVGMIKTSPEKLIAQGTDWRFLNQLKREMKA